MPFANNGDVRLNYEAVGGGPDIVLVHANPFDRRLAVFRWRFFRPVPHGCNGSAGLRRVGQAGRSFHIR